MSLPESTFTQANLDKISKQKGHIDLLDESEEDLPQGQKYIVMSYVEPDPCLVELYETLAISMFFEKCGEGILKRAVSKKDYRQFLKELKNFKIINFEVIKKKFEELYNDNYDTLRILKFYGAYPNTKLAQKRAESLSQNNKNIDVYTQQAGFWVPFRPSPELCNDTKYADKRMNDLMHAHIDNKKILNTHFNRRKELAQEKAFKEAEGKIQRIKSDVGGTILEGETVKLERKHTDKELEEEFEKFNPKNIIDSKIKDEERKHEKLFKKLITVEKGIDDGEALHPDVKKKFNELENSK